MNILQTAMFTDTDKRVGRIRERNPFGKGRKTCKTNYFCLPRFAGQRQ
ncbi:hypothetical protein [Methylomonas koyamae]|nr:hypothetical protein [Methylomonas koyamae]WNB74353.1 hypothetical protein RI210_13810 [Methylomonas koyamae]